MLDTPPARTAYREAIVDNIPRSAEEYRKWWAENIDVPYGYCWCGCGIKTTLSQATSRIHGYIKGEPRRLLHGHANRLYRKALGEDFQRRWEQERPDIPYGLCWCGCGEQTKIVTHTKTVYGTVKGEPGRFLKGHRVQNRGIRFSTWQPGEESVDTSISSVAFRICYVCGCTKPLSSTFFARQTRKGEASGRYLSRLCFVCNRLDAKARYDAATEEERERVRIRMRKWSRENPAIRNKKAKEWRRKNPEKAREISRRAMERQQERMEQDEEYRATVLRWSTVTSSRRRVQMRRTDEAYTAADIQQMYEDQEGKCAYCECELHGEYHADHMVPLSRGGSNDTLNIALSCQPCNQSKFTKTAEEFYTEYLA